MGLDTSHNCWHGSYGRFMEWRRQLAKACDLPPLDLMDGFYVPLDEGINLPSLYPGNVNGGASSTLKRLDTYLPISWECLDPNPIYELLHHSDCDGEIPHESCGPIADSLEAIINKMPDEWQDKTQKFIDGLKLAASLNENVEFY